jgi:two-component sensor histidine kinase
LAVVLATDLRLAREQAPMHGRIVKNARVDTRPPPRRSRLSLPVRLGLLIAATVLPLTVFAAIQIYYNYDINRRAAFDGILQIARGLATAADAELRTAIAALEVLALSEPLRRDDLDAFRRQAETLVQAYFPGSNVVLSDASGQQLLNTAVPQGTPLPRYVRMDALRRVFDQGQPQVSNLLLGPVLRRHIIVVDVPVRRDGRVVYALAMSLPLQVFDNVIHTQRPGADWTIAIFDRDASVIARVPGGERAVGQKPSETLYPALTSGAEGVLETVTVEGVDVLTGFTRAPLSGWSVAVGIPKQNLTGPLWRAVVILSGFGALCLLLATMVAGRLAARVARTEAARDLLINELNHRVKNTLATVQSMAVNTLKRSGSAADACEAIEARLMAMSRAHDVLTEDYWSGVDLGELLESIVEPYRNFPGQINLVGPPLRINPRAAVTVAMVFNELTTNAVKYGALSSRHGTVTLAWSLAEARAPKTLRLDWTEADGPPVSAPASRGFGSLLIAQGVERELKGTLALHFAPGGLICTIEVPLQRVAA